jgi:hypothetical protein
VRVMQEGQLALEDDLQSTMTIAWELRVWRHCADEPILIVIAPTVLVVGLRMSSR